jgi:hypothetical protein
VAETDLRRTVVTALRPLDAIAVENLVYKGTPDVNYVEGWIELKWLRAWPKRPTTKVRLDHPLTQEQRVWLTKRWRAGGNCYVLLQVGREYLLFTGQDAACSLGDSTREELETYAIMVWHNGLNRAEFLEWIRSGRML